MATDGRVLAVLFASVALCSFVGYHNVLFNFFCGDDFVHLTWLSRAVDHPDMLWENFHSNWLNVPTAKFYRPLISVFMFSDYAIWKTNGLGFHITNLLCHIFSSLALGAVLIELCRISGIVSNRSGQIWAFAAALLFAVYPGHPEAVSWITGRVDSIVTMFCLSSYWCYLRCSSSRSIVWLIPSLIGFMLALMSKEMAVTIPILVSLTAAFFTQNSISGKPRLFVPLSYWLVLVCYFLVRKIALGTFIGGYDDSLGGGSDLPAYLAQTMRSFVETIAPINKEVFLTSELSSKSLIALWMAFIAVLSVLTVTASLKERALKLLAFVMLWFGLCLAPIYKLFNIGVDLQGSRLIYLASAPLCAFLTLGIALYKNPPQRAWLRPALSAPILILSLVVLIGNNHAWQVSGQQMSSMLSALNQLAKNNHAKGTYITGLPDNYAGAYLCRNAIEGMTAPPQITRAIPNCFRVDNFDQVFPFGFAKDAMQSDHQNQILAWNFDKKALEKISLGEERYFSASWQPAAILELIDHKRSENVSAVNNGISGIEVRTDQARFGRLALRFSYLPCWRGEFISFTIFDLKGAKPEQMYLTYSNERLKSFDLRHRVSPLVGHSESKITLTYALRAEADWAFGGERPSVCLNIPKETSFVLDQLSVPYAKREMPLTFMKPAFNQNQNGYIELSPKNPNAHIELNAAELPDATGLKFEVSYPSKFFSDRNGSGKGEALSQTLSQSRTLAGNRAQINLQLQDFSQDGIYHIRGRALDQSGSPIGFAGDNLVLTVHHS